MSRVYGAPIEVVESGGRPVRFTWGGRIHTVRRVIDHWVTLRAEWAAEAEESLPQRRHWRVEAGSDRSLGVYELRHDVAGGGWTLVRVLD
ncbi:DUF6504 family protein [Nocardiopsis sp. RSe5-2]|uniref:DUF6504 family protein n=1 Tax=Nocardiopsis endophytica TaxID=3018445 RepID=A0ABT4U0T6_9ACTN|nr:DUF6504 family protein [Nocardiopsis endophytica]MDA2810541.1 DUF6504 family protein [Nocardiopsis endophytica]